MSEGEPVYNMCGNCFRVTCLFTIKGCFDDDYCSGRCRDKGDLRHAITHAIKQLEDHKLDSSKLKVALRLVAK